MLPHLELGLAAVAPPPREARQVRAVVPLVHEETRDATRARVQILVAAPPRVARG